MKNIISFAPTSLVTAVLTASALACSPTATSAAPAGTATTTSTTSLDGRTFVVEGSNVPPGQPSQIDLVFSGGTLDPSVCHAAGLPPIAYSLAADGTFHAERRHGDSVDMWSGRVVGDAIEGTMVSQTKGMTTMNVTFHGRAR